MSKNTPTPPTNLVDNLIPLIEHSIPLPPTQSLFPHDPNTQPRDARTPLDEYVKDFALPHGYKISIGHSTPAQNTVTYQCSRSGRPGPHKDQTKASKSLKIECPFEMVAHYLPHLRSWTLSHVHTTHNHPPYHHKHRPVHVIPAQDITTTPANGTDQVGVRFIFIPTSTFS